MPIDSSKESKYMRLQVKMAKDAVVEIDNYANSMGMSRSGLCAYFIGIGLLNLKKADKVLNAAGGELISMMSDEAESISKQAFLMAKDL